jgi:hypothetical protein
VTAAAKLGLVAAGYVVAFVVATASVALYVASTSGPDRQASSGMYAFGDSLLFLAVLGVAAVPPTAAALFFLRPCHSFWRVLAIAALVIAATGLTALVVCLVARAADASAAAQSWSGYAVLRILVAPLFALAFLLSGVFAPRRPARIALWAATVSEAVVFAYWLILLPRSPTG